MTVKYMCYDGFTMRSCRTCLILATFFLLIFGISSNDCTGRSPQKRKWEWDTISYVAEVQYSSDGLNLLYCFEDGSISLAEIETETTLWLENHGGSVAACKLSPNNDFIFSAGGIVSSEYPVKVWDVHSPGSQTLLSVHTSSVSSIAVHPDPMVTILVSGSWSTFEIWDYSGAGTHRFTSTVPTYKITFNPSGSVLATGKDALIQLWNSSSFSSDPTQVTENKNKQTKPLYFFLYVFFLKACFVLFCFVFYI